MSIFSCEIAGFNRSIKSCSDLYSHLSSGRDNFFGQIFLQAIEMDESHMHFFSFNRSEVYAFIHTRCDE